MIAGLGCDTNIFFTCSINFAIVICYACRRAKSHNRLIGKISTVQRYKNQCKIEIFFEIKSIRVSCRYKTSEMSNSLTTIHSQKPPPPCGVSTSNSSGGAQRIVRRAKRSRLTIHSCSISGCEKVRRPMRAVMPVW